MAKIYFITGIDTGIGKTYATGFLGRYLKQQGKSVVTAKIAQTGCTGMSDDIVLHRKIMDMDLLPEDTSGNTCPYVFELPVSPHLAAKAEEKSIETNVILESINKLKAKYDYVIVEGAGGLLVPLSPDILTVDFVAANNWPIIVVSSPRLGSINHTLMTLECLKNRNCLVAGIIYNLNQSSDPAIIDDSRNIFTEYLCKDFSEAALVDLPKIVNDDILELDFAELLK